MQDNAYEIGTRFFQIYWKPDFEKVLDVGSYNHESTLRDVCPAEAEYIGVDLQEGLGVDIVLEEPGRLPFEDMSMDCIVSSSKFGHDMAFWLTLVEMTRVLRAGGYIYVNAPSYGPCHQDIYDYWRFYPDAGLALQEWVRKQGYRVTLIESFTARRGTGAWGDLVMIFTRDIGDAIVPERYLSDSCSGAYNVRKVTNEGMENISSVSETEELIDKLDRENAELRRQLISLQSGLDGRDSRIDRLERNLDEVLSTVSWRVTAPFRRAGEVVGMFLPRRVQCCAMQSTVVEADNNRTAQEDNSNEPEAIEWVTQPEGHMEENLDMPLHRALELMQNRILFETTYYGIRTLKSPIDAWVYQELIFATRPDYIVELGTLYGGSALMLAHLCDNLGSGMIISCDRDQKQVAPDIRLHPRIELIEGDVCSLFDQIAERVGQQTNVMVIEDTSHSMENTLEVLRLYSRLIRPGQYFIIEDSNAHHGVELGPLPGPGPYEAIKTFLSENPQFVADRGKESFFITWNPNGYLRRIV